MELTWRLPGVIHASLSIGRDFAKPGLVDPHPSLSSAEGRTATCACFDRSMLHSTRGSLFTQSKHGTAAIVPVSVLAQSRRLRRPCEQLPAAQIASCARGLPLPSRFLLTLRCDLHCRPSVRVRCGETTISYQALSIAHLDAKSKSLLVSF